MPDIFQTRIIKPMLIGATGGPFDDPDFIYELKWDGERCLAYLDPAHGTTLINKRGVRMLPKVPELANIHEQVRGRCILDGELAIIENGKPNFSAIQRRSIMSNTFRLRLDAQQRPACFIAFDILYDQDTQTMNQPLIDRKQRLHRVVKAESDRLAVSRFYEGAGTLLFTLTQERELEGIVAKRRDSLYWPGKRTKDWIKIKNLQDEDFVVCGWVPKDNHMTSLVLGQYHGDTLVYQGHVTLGVGGAAFDRIRRMRSLGQPACSQVPPGHGNEDARWIEPGLVCTVAYMERTAGGGMRQPVFKGLRDDKSPQDCVASKPAN